MFDGFSIIDVFLISILVIVSLIIGLILYKKSKSFQKNSKLDLKSNYKYVMKKIECNIANFEEEKFLRWVRNIFTSYKEKFSNNNITELSLILKKEFYFKVEEELKEYSRTGQKYITNNFCILDTSIIDYKETEKEDIIYVYVKCKMIEYVFDENRKQILTGSDKLYIYKNYQLELTKAKGLQLDNGKKDINCQKCGAIIKLSTEGRCDNCGTLIVTNEHDFMISDIKEIFI